MTTETTTATKIELTGEEIIGLALWAYDCGFQNAVNVIKSLDITLNDKAKAEVRAAVIEKMKLIPAAREKPKEGDTG
jgi:hypothetical protein